MAWYDDIFGAPGSTQMGQMQGLLGGLGAGLLAAGAGGQPIGSRGQALAQLPLLAMQGQSQGMQQARMQRQMQREDQRDAAWAQMFGGPPGAGGQPQPGADMPAAGAAAPAGGPAAMPGAGQGGMPGAPSGSLLAGIPPHLIPILRMMGPEAGSAMLGRILAQQPQQHVVGPGGALVDNRGQMLFQAPQASKLLSPEEFAQQAQLRQLGAQRTSVNVRLPPMEQAFAQKYGGGAAEEALNLGQADAKATEALSNLNRFSAALERFPTGAAANTRLTIGQWAQQLGIPDSMLPQGVNREATASGEEMRALTGQMLRDAIGPGGFPAQNFSNADREMLERSLANIGTSPEGNRQIIANATAAAQRNREVAQALRDWLMRNGTTADSYLRFQQTVLPGIRERNIIAPAAGSTAAPAQPGATRQNPAQPAVAGRAAANQALQRARRELGPGATDDQVVQRARQLMGAGGG